MSTGTLFILLFTILPFQPTFLASRGVVLACRRAQPFWPQILTGIFHRFCHRFHSDRSQYSSSQMVDSFTPSPQTAVLSCTISTMVKPTTSTPEDPEDMVHCDPKYQVLLGRNYSHFVQPWHISQAAKRVCERLSVFKNPDLSHQGPQTTELGKQHLGPDASYFLAHSLKCLLSGKQFKLLKMAVDSWFT